MTNAALAHGCAPSNATLPHTGAPFACGRTRARGAVAREALVALAGITAVAVRAGGRRVTDAGVGHAFVDV